MKIRSIERRPFFGLDNTHRVTLFRDDWNHAGKCASQLLDSQELFDERTGQIYPISGWDYMKGQLRIYIRCGFDKPELSPGTKVVLRDRKV